jgi:GNAT superfamily N-acetyltransferase
MQGIFGIDHPIAYPGLASLFDPALPDHPVLWSVLQGRHMGLAVVDDLDQPTQCVLRTDACLTYVSRDIAPTFLGEAIPRMLVHGDVWLVWPTESRTATIPPAGGKPNLRFEFTGCDPHSALLANLQLCLPAGFAIQRIDELLLERCEWRDEMIFYCGSVDRFLAYDLGICLMRGEEIIVEAYASSFGERLAEIGAITRQEHRGHGYAPITCAYLIEMLDSQGYLPYWSCDEGNQASIRVAEKLGFHHKKSYLILEYQSTPKEKLNAKYG